MSPISFVLKSFFLSFLISFVIGAFSGFIIDLIIPPFPHQLFPNWLAMGIISAFVGIISGLSVALYMILKEKEDIKRLLIISCTSAFIVMVFALIWMLV